MDYFLSTTISILMVSLCIVIHYEVLNYLSRLIHNPRRHRWMIILMMHGLLLAHVLEVWIFGLGHYAATQWLNLGTVHLLENGEISAFFDHIYYSAMVYTTVGFGDMVPSGAIRMMTSTEAVSGLALIAWSASFTFLQMQRIWKQ